MTIRPASLPCPERLTVRSALRAAAYLTFAALVAVCWFVAIVAVQAWDFALYGKPRKTLDEINHQH